MPLRVVWKNLLRHPVRSVLTMGSLTVAVFLLSTLHTFVSALDATVEGSRDDRIIVQSAVSLFVPLPNTYQQRIEAVEGVEESCRWHWFGGYYEDPSNFFGQFACDQDTLLEVYPEIEIIAGSREDFETRRTACLIGTGLAERFGFEVGDTIPIISNIYQRTNRDEQAWQFDVAAIYDTQSPTIDKQTLYFHFDYLDEGLDTGAATGGRGTSTYTLNITEGADPVAVMSAIDLQFANGPIKTQSVPQAAFNKQFVSMWGNVPTFVGAIGLAVFAAVLLASVNTMLIAARQQTHDVGIMKALGFSDGAMCATLFAQSLLLSVLGGGFGLLLSAGLPFLMAGSPLEVWFPHVGLRPETLVLGTGAILLVGVLAGLFPALRALRLSPVSALRSED